MKKSICLLLFFTLFVSNIFADSLVLDLISAGVNIANDIHDDKEEIKKMDKISIFEIKTRASKLEKGSDMNLFYEENKVDVFKAAILNLTIGFGIGSKIQGNFTSFQVQKMVDSISLATGLSVSLGLFVSGLIIPSFYALSSDELTKVIVTPLLISGGIIVVNHIYGFFNAIIYGNSFNNKLKKELNIAFVPNIESNSISVIKRIVI